ncbi:mas-related G-protein coupled receptor member X3-like [Ochotona princeps]|uniref:mas-related G-protein coupled receptor member X3-like n=1 Tax=Ochotona princeps TaxID=9978 RepID=UPI002714CA47|nr:mas-related G-protein coupled receptor member X3-like [Ochotona princeps]
MTSTTEEMQLEIKSLQKLDKPHWVTSFEASSSRLLRIKRTEEFHLHHHQSSSAAKRRMEERNTSGGNPSLNPNILVLGTTLAPKNGSSLTTTRPVEYLILGSLIIIIALVGLGGNATVIWLLGFRMRRNGFTVYIINLAIADFLLLCCVITDRLLAISFSHLSSKPLNIIQLLQYVTVFPYIVGLSILSAISTERCLSVLWPIWYRCHRPRKLSVIMCALLWAVCLILSILEGRCCISFVQNRFIHQCKNIDFIITSWLIFLFTVLLASNLTLVVRVFCGSQHIQLSRLYVTILLTVLVFLLCGLPFGLFCFLISQTSHSYSKYFGHFFLVTAVLSIVNSCANPIIYFFVGSFRQQKRQPLKLVLERALQGTPEDDE